MMGSTGYGLIQFHWIVSFSVYVSLEKSLNLLSQIHVEYRALCIVDDLQCDTVRKLSC